MCIFAKHQSSAYKANMTAPVTIPDSKYGFTRTKYNLPVLPQDLPERNVLEAANKLNSHLFQNLTNRQRLFVEEYFGNGFDEFTAAVHAGLVIESDPRAPKQARAILSKKYIQQAIEAGWSYYRETVKVSLPEVIAEIRKVAFSNMADYVETDANDELQLRLPGNDERHLLAAVSEITIDEYKEGRGESARECKRVKFKLYSKMDALDKLLKLATAADSAVAGNTVNVNTGDVNTTHTSITQINIVAVPAGKFIDAPAKLESIIEQQSMLTLVSNPTVTSLTG